MTEFDPKHVMDATSAFYDSCVKLEAGRPGWPGTVHMEAAMNKLIELGWKTPEQHDARVTELLAANNVEVERRRQAERDRHAGCFCLTCNPGMLNDAKEVLAPVTVEHALDCGLRPLGFKGHCTCDFMQRLSKVLT